MDLERPCPAHLKLTINSRSLKRWPMNTVKPLSVGVIGAGSIASGMHLPTLLAMDDCSIAWIMDAAPERARALTRAFGLDHATTPANLAEASPCDAILFAIPLPPRMALFDALLPGDCAILAEKPLMTTGAEHRSLVERFAPWRISVGYQRRQYATNRLLKNIVASGVFGALLSVSAAEGGRITRSGGAGGYQDLPVEEGGGVTRNLGCHGLDSTLWIAGATTAKVLDRKIEWDGRTDRMATARMRIEGVNGVAGHDVDLDWRVSWLDAPSNEVAYRFETAVVTGPVTPGDSLRVFDSKGVEVAPLMVAGTKGALSVGQACYLEWRDLVEAFRSRSEPPTSARSTLLTAEVMDALLT